MSWYKTGTINVTKNSNIVTGVGTKWTNQLSGVSAGRMLILQTSKQIEIYEIESVQSDTQLTLSDNYSGETLKGLKYRIPTSPSVSIEQFALEIASSLAYHQKQLDGWQKILTGSGDVTLTAPDGQKITMKSQKSLSSAIDSAVKKTGDTMTGQLTLAQHGVKLPFDNGNSIALKISSDNYSHIFYDSETQQRTSILVYNPTKNEWNFPYVNDVTINGKSVLKIGDYGIGSLTGAPMTNPDERLLSGWYATKTSNYPDLSGNDSAALIVYSTENKKYCIEQILSIAGKTAKIRIRCRTPDGAQSWDEFITTANSTVDSNGFYKKASPIVRLFGSENINPAEGFTQSGCGLVNELAKGVVAKRIDVGHYEIHGSLGFAKDGWYITLPEDANGNKKFFAEYSIDDNNVITVKTYTRKFSTKLCEIVAGDPIDITDGRWIDLRVEMPEMIVEQTEESVSELDSSTPNDDNV
ncbi:hypothetical protein [Gilliamella apicola]|uniref:phage tail fiber protein n=1 Tax=Gilliamella apicola TaxID=1196095 RepID=UPI00080D9861|nr:hypothetical protein [Gilliamella apicola]OCG12699.1 hypothetical protein A9G14_04930 [Gilliamella apicola]